MLQQKEIALARRRHRRNSATPTMGVRDIFTPSFCAELAQPQKEISWVKPHVSLQAQSQPQPQPQPKPSPPLLPPPSNDVKGKPVVIHTQVYRRRRRSMPVMSQSQMEGSPYYTGAKPDSPPDAFSQEQYLLAKSGHFLTPEGAEQMIRTREKRRERQQQPVSRSQDFARQLPNRPQRSPVGGQNQPRTAEKLTLEQQNQHPSQKYRVEQRLLLQSLPPFPGSGQMRRTRSEQRIPTDLRSPTTSRQDYQYLQERRNSDSENIYPIKQTRQDRQRLDAHNYSSPVASQNLPSIASTRRNSDSQYSQPQGYARRRERRPPDLPLSSEHSFTPRTEFSSPDSLPEIRARKDSDPQKFIRRRVRRISISDFQNVDLSMEDHPDGMDTSPTSQSPSDFRQPYASATLPSRRRSRNRQLPLSPSIGYSSSDSQSPTSSSSGVLTTQSMPESIAAAQTNAKPQVRTRMRPQIPASNFDQNQTFDSFGNQANVKPRRNSDSQFFRRRQRTRSRPVEQDYDSSASEASEPPCDPGVQAPRRNSDSQKYVPRARNRQRRMSESQAYSPQNTRRARDPAALQPGHIRSRELGSGPSPSDQRQSSSVPPLPRIIVTSSDEASSGGQLPDFRPRSNSDSKRVRPKHRKPVLQSVEPAPNVPVVETQEYRSRSGSWDNSLLNRHKPDTKPDPQKSRAPNPPGKPPPYSQNMEELHSRGKPTGRRTPERQNYHPRDSPGRKTPEKQTPVIHVQTQEFRSRSRSAGRKTPDRQQKPPPDSPGRGTPPDNVWGRIPGIEQSDLQEKTRKRPTQVTQQPSEMLDFRTHVTVTEVTIFHHIVSRRRPTCNGIDGHCGPEDKSDPKSSTGQLSWADQMLASENESTMSSPSQSIANTNSNSTPGGQGMMRSYPETQPPPTFGMY